MPDAKLTAQVLQRALAAGDERRLWPALGDVDAAAGIAPPAANGTDDALVQEPRRQVSFSGNCLMPTHPAFVPLLTSRTELAAAITGTRENTPVVRSIGRGAYLG